MQKHGSGSIGGIQSHNERERESKSNPDIDSSKSELNYSLVECANYRQAIKANIDDLDLKRAVRKDAVFACSFVVTSSQDFFQDKNEAEIQDFFADSVRFFQDRYGERNIIAATVHLDETTPHMHLLMTPIRDGKLSAKAIFNRQELRDLQTDLHATVGQPRGLERGREGSDRAHLSENRFKAEKALEAAQEAEEQRRAAEEMLKQLEPRVLKAEEVSRLQGKKTLLGGLKGVTFAEYESLKETAGRVDEAEARADRAEGDASEARKELRVGRAQIAEQTKQLAKDRAGLDKEKARLEAEKQKTPSKDLLKRNKELVAENQRLDGILRRVKIMLVSVLPELKKILAPEKLERVNTLIESAKEVDRSQSLGH